MAEQDSRAEDMRREISLRGKWKFEIGDDIRYSEENFNDNRWVSIYVPEHWENAGFPGYDGYAWYRVQFHLRRPSLSKDYYIKLGKIDDVDMAYLNGHPIGSTGEFPPNFDTEYNKHRTYYIPHGYLNKDDVNVIAVRVYDEHSRGGIYSGDVGIYSKKTIPLHKSFAGSWKFSPGDNPEWKNMSYNDEGWSEIMVPGRWESQGFNYLDGFAWYRKWVDVPANKTDDHLILVLGMIDDQDEVYLNGKKIGHTGPSPLASNNNTYCRDYRFYYVPPSSIRKDSKNLIAIRVYDKQGSGGIIEGAIGITTRKNYLKMKRYFK